MFSAVGAGFIPALTPQGIDGFAVGAGFIPALTPQGIDGFAVGAGFIPALTPVAVIFYRGGFIFALRGEGGDEPRPYGVSGNLLSRGIYICFAG